MVPFLDLEPANSAVKAAFLRDAAELVDRGSFTNGAQVEEFERAFATYCGVASCVGLASGLDALRLALLSIGLKPGDEVIAPANTFLATFEAVTQAGGVPVPVDVGLTDYNLDTTAVEAALGSRTRVVLPVHLYGQMADMRPIRSIASEHGLAIIEDACQAHGAKRDGLTAGASGDAAAFSFYPGKNLGAFGDAGALVTNSSEIAETVRALREHGQRAKYRHDSVGYTARLDTIQAIALLHKLPLLGGWNEARRETARAYDERLSDIGDLLLPPVPLTSEPVWHLYVVRTRYRNRLSGHLRELGVATGKHYPEPAHLSRAYANLGFTRGAFPVTESLADEVLSLPIFPGITEEQVDSVAGAIRAFFDRGL